MNRGVTLTGVALHFDARALTTARYVLGRAEIGAAWLDARWPEEVASDRGVRLVGDFYSYFYPEAYYRR
jgi:hypothetical protein